MKPLEPPDSHHLSAAVGWLGLGNVAEAGAELEKIAPQFHSHPDVLTVQFDIHAATGKWDAAAEIAGTLTQLEPEEPGTWVSLAYATRRKTPSPRDSNSSPADLSQGTNHRLQPGVL